VELKSQIKTTGRKAWEAFKSWRKRGMWFRVTILLIIFFSALFERLLTPDHVPLINEYVWIACKAIRAASEPRVMSAQLRYLHVQKSRQLQNQLREKVKSGDLQLNPEEMKLLTQNTVDANYNKLFALAERAKLIPGNITLRQSKRAMLDKACQLTSERFDPEWKNIRQETRKEYPFHPDVLLMKLKMLGYGILMIFPLPLIPGLSWLFLCFTLGVWGASFNSKFKFSLFAASSVIMTFVWLYFSAYVNKNWEGWRADYLWTLLGTSVFLAIWAFIGSIMGKRLYEYAARFSKEKYVLISLLFLSGIILTMPFTFFHRRLAYCFWPAAKLIFKTYAFVPYLISAGLIVLCEAWFLTCKNYPEKSKKYIWLLLMQGLLIIFIIYKLIFVLDIFSE
jgi:hypothetical protein